MQRIQELMQEISTDELREAMSKVDEALRNVKPEDLRKAMENLKFSMEDFNKNRPDLQLESIKKNRHWIKHCKYLKKWKNAKCFIGKTKESSQNSEQLAQEQKYC